MHRTALALATALTALTASGSLHAAEDWIKPGSETVKLNLGGILNRNSTTLRLDGPNSPGTEFDLENVAGLEREASSLYASATWRLAPKHRVGVQFFEARHAATKTLDRTLVIEDQVFPVNTTLRTEHDTTYLIFNYQYSFVRNDNIEVAGLAGLYGARARYRFSASAPAVDVDASTTVPLPVLGASLDWFVSPRWTVSAYGEGLAVQMGSVDGRMYLAGVSSDYMLTRNFGLGLGYNVTGLTVQAAESDFSGKIRWRQSSLFGYAQLRF